VRRTDHGAPVVLYGCETWSLTLREERRLRVFENRVLRRIFGSAVVNTVNTFIVGFHFLQSRIPLIRIKWDGVPSGYAENSDNWIFL
jgi:hypothetical protein